MQYPIIDNLIYAYQRNGWTGLDIPETITYEPIQLGSGDPSPNNIRQILPATTLNIGGVDVPVYGGSLDINTGVLTVDMYMTPNLKNRTWTLETTSYGNVFCSNAITNKALNFNFFCNKYYNAETYRTNLTNFEIGTFNATNGRNRFCICDNRFSTVSEFVSSINDVIVVYEITTPTTYQLTNEELINAIGIKDDIAHRLKLPMLKYFSHVVIEALQKAAAGTQTEDDEEILRHYLAPLGIGGI